VEHRHVLLADLEMGVDIGANWEQFTLMAKEWTPQGSVIAFEPLSKAAGKFREMMREN